MDKRLKAMRDLADERVAASCTAEHRALAMEMAVREVIAEMREESITGRHWASKLDAALERSAGKQASKGESDEK